MDERFEQMFHRIYKCPAMCIKKYVINHQKNANESHNEIPLPTTEWLKFKTQCWEGTGTLPSCHVNVKWYNHFRKRSDSYIKQEKPKDTLTL